MILLLSRANASRPVAALSRAARSSYPWQGRGHEHCANDHRSIRELGEQTADTHRSAAQAGGALRSCCSRTPGSNQSTKCNGGRVACRARTLAGRRPCESGSTRTTLSGPLLERYFQGLGFNHQAARAWVILLTAGGLQSAERKIVDDAADRLHDNIHFAALVERVRRSPWFCAPLRNSTEQSSFADLNEAANVDRIMQSHSPPTQRPSNWHQPEDRIEAVEGPGDVAVACRSSATRRTPSSRSLLALSPMMSRCR
jgi:hypothetical protein